MHSMFTHHCVFFTLFHSGERLIKSIYEALRAGPKWEETLFLITYDEHGEYFGVLL